MTSSPTSRFTSLSLLVLCAAVPACGMSSSSSSMGASAAPPVPPAADAARAISEADIIQLDSGRLYAMSKSGTVSIVDVSTPDTLTMLGQTKISGQPFEMYLRGGYLVAMSNGAVDQSGAAVPPTYGDTPSALPQNAGSELTVLDVRDAAHPTSVATRAVPGELADSRIVGDVLYLATYENSECYGCGSAPRTMVTSFDVSDPTAIAQVDQASFQSNAPDSYNLAWGTNWKRSIFVNDQRLYIGGHADVDPSTLSQNTAKEGIIDVLDITDPHGRLHAGARIVVAGAILSRWQLDERDGVLRVISQQGAGRTGNGVGMPSVDTFRIDSTQSFVPLGHTALRLPRQEGLRTVRFDADRAYAITYNQTDPLFAIDLSDPSAPAQRGQLQMPGFMFYLEPHGDRVIGLGIDRADPNGSLNVSLFDVSDLDKPTMIKRVAFAGASFSEDYEILNGELPEDQDRIQKAFHVFDDGLVAVPFSSASGCSDGASGVQLVSWQNGTLARAALLPVPGNPRRAFENQGEMVTVSDSNVREFALSSAATTSIQKADVVIGTCVQDSPTYYGGGGGYNGGYEGGYYDAKYGSGCSLGGPLSSGEGEGIASLALVALAVVSGRRRRA